MLTKLISKVKNREIWLADGALTRLETPSDPFISKARPLLINGWLWTGLRLNIFEHQLQRGVPVVVILLNLITDGKRLTMPELIGQVSKAKPNGR